MGGGGQVGADATPDFAELNTPLLCICKEVIFRLFLRHHQNFESDILVNRYDLVLNVYVNTNVR